MRTLPLLFILLAGCQIPFLSKEKADDSETLPLLALLGAASALQGNETNCNLLNASPPSGTSVADNVVSAPAQTGSGFRNSRCAVDGVRGTGTTQGSTDVFSLNATGTGASITLEWNGKKITDGTGVDFIVYENAFYQNENTATRFMEPIVVEVSYDGSRWCGFSPNYTNTPETTYSTNPAHWSNFAGIEPVLYNQDSSAMNAATLFSSGGGDAFDLANLTTTATTCAGVVSNAGCNGTDVTTLRGNSASQGVRYVRLTAATACTNSDTGALFVQDSGAFSGGPDIDGVIARYVSNLP
ncbi:MAG: LIC_13355 family lipoprotein [Spirochaetia bacterium]|nr:LIC_13355 family lipoprotein [Spirochaetia bacterium]